MASGPITSWQVDGETVTDFVFLGSKTTADGDCSHEIKRHLLLGRIVMTNLDSLLKSRDTTLPTKDCLVKAMVFPCFSSSHVWMWDLEYKESWAPKSWCFWTMVLEKTLESPLDCKEIKPVHRKGNQSWMYIGRTDAEVQYFGHLEKILMLARLMAGGDGDNRGWDGWMASLTQWTRVWVNSGSWQWTGRPGLMESMGSPRVRHNWVTELNWMESRSSDEVSFNPTTSIRYTDDT